MTSVGALPPVLPRSRQNPAAAAEGGDAFAAMLAGFGAVTAVPTASGPLPQGPAVVSGPVAGVPATGPLGAGVVQAGVVQAGVVQAGVVQAGLTVGLVIGPVQSGPVEAAPVQSGPVEATPVQSGPAEATPVEAGPAAASVPPWLAGAGGLGMPAGRQSPDPRSPALPQTAVPVVETPDGTALPATAPTTTAPVVLETPGVPRPLGSTAAITASDNAVTNNPVDVAADFTAPPATAGDLPTAPTTAPALDPSDGQPAGDQTGAEPEPQAPLLDAVGTDQLQLADVRPIGTDQAVGALGEARRTDAVAPVAAPAPAAPPPPPAAQVFQLLTPLLEGPDGTHTVSLQLHPEELGAVQVDVALLRGEITLALHARDVGAQDALRAALPMLRAELEASGLVATSVSVDGGRADQQPGERPDRPGQHGGSLPGGSGDGAPAGPPVPTTSDPDAALDVRM